MLKVSEKKKGNTKKPPRERRLERAAKRNYSAVVIEARCSFTLP